MSEEATVPKSRFDEVIAARRAADDKVRELEAQLRTAQSAESRLTAAEADLARYRAMESGWSEERAILAAGVTDPDGIDFARHAWSRLPANARPAGGLAAWLGQRDALPKAVQAYLPPAAGGATVQTPASTVAAGGATVQTPASTVAAGGATVQTPASTVAAGGATVQTPASTVAVPASSGSAGSPAGSGLSPDQLRALAADVATGRRPAAEWEAAMAALNSRGAR